VFGRDTIANVDGIRKAFIDDMKAGRDEGVGGAGVGAAGNCTFLSPPQALSITRLAHSTAPHMIRCMEVLQVADRFRGPAPRREA
jgi:hypothetical protein